jgi:hypothetical protein
MGGLGFCKLVARGRPCPLAPRYRQPCAGVAADAALAGAPTGRANGRGVGRFGAAMMGGARRGHDARPDGGGAYRRGASGAAVSLALPSTLGGRVARRALEG